MQYTKSEKSMVHIPEERCRDKRFLAARSNGRSHALKITIGIDHQLGCSIRTGLQQMLYTV